VLKLPVEKAKVKAGKRPKYVQCKSGALEKSDAAPRKKPQRRY
jgi:hypothetical protein